MKEIRGISWYGFSSRGEISKRHIRKCKQVSLDLQAQLGLSLYFVFSSSCFGFPIRFFVMQVISDIYKYFGIFRISNKQLSIVYYWKNASDLYINLSTGKYTRLIYPFFLYIYF